MKIAALYKGMILQSALRRIWLYETQIDGKREELKHLQERHAGAVGPVLSALQTGTPIEHGFYAAAIDVDKRKCISYKDLLVAEIGADKVESIVANIEPRETPYLVVSKGGA